MSYEEKQPSVGKTTKALVSIAAYNKPTNRVKAALAVGGWVANEYMKNKEFYDDIIKFNCFNSIRPALPPVGRRVSFGNPPSEALEVIDKVYKMWRHTETRDIFTRLGTAPTGVNQYSPVEGKWAFEYIRRFGYTYDAKNKLSLAELIKPLSSSEFVEYMRLR